MPSAHGTITPQWAPAFDPMDPVCILGSSGIVHSLSNGGTVTPAQWLGFANNMRISAQTGRAWKLHWERSLIGGPGNWPPADYPYDCKANAAELKSFAMMAETIQYTPPAYAGEDIPGRTQVDTAGRSWRDFMWTNANGGKGCEVVLLPQWPPLANPSRPDTIADLLATKIYNFERLCDEYNAELWAGIPPCRLNFSIYVWKRIFTDIANSVGPVSNYYDMHMSTTDVHDSPALGQYINWMGHRVRVYQRTPESIPNPTNRPALTTPYRDYLGLIIREILAEKARFIRVNPATLT